MNLVVRYRGMDYAVQYPRMDNPEPEEVLHFQANDALENAIQTIVKMTNCTWQDALHSVYKQVARAFAVEEDALYSLWVKHHGPTYGLPIQTGGSE